MRMRISTLAIVVSLLAASACGRASEPADAPAAGRAESASSDRPNVVAQARIDSCAGFDVDKAAGMLGLTTTTDLEAQERFVERLGSQMCRYWSVKSNIGPGLDFLLNIKDSSAEAARVLASLRRSVPAVDGAIRGARSQSAGGPLLVEFEGIGDEAFWDITTGGVSLRVRNVIATIHASTSNHSVSDRDPAQMDLERRVAEEVAQGLGGR